MARLPFIRIHPKGNAMNRPTAASPCAETAVRRPTLCPVAALLVFALAAPLAGSPAHAQAAPKPEDKKDETTRLETVTVTAQRREQELQSVPLPVSTFTARDLELRNVVDTLKLTESIPNMFASNNTGLGTANVYYIRGLGNTESIATFDPPVGTYVNDVYVSRQNANNFGLFDVERIEVLRGPQGTLFGRNTTGGAINVILKKPGKNLGGYLSVGAGRFGETNSRGSVDVPVADHFRTKFSYFYRKDDGYADNLTTGQKNNAADSFGVRAAFWWRVADVATWEVAMDKIDDKGTSLFNARVGDQRQTRTGLRTDCPGFLTPAGAARLTGPKNGFCLGNDVENGSITSNLNLALDGVSVDFITGWRDLTQKFALDFLNNPVSTGGFTIVNDGEHRQFTQEVKLSGEREGLAYVAGLFYLNERNTTDFGDLFYLAPPANTTIVLADRIMKNTTKSSAVFAQGDYKLTPQTTLTAGLRYSKETKRISFTDTRAGIPAAAQLSDANIAAAGIPLAQETTLATPRVALSYQVNRDLMLFASATRGFKSGGWNARGTNFNDLQPFLPEKIWSYEAGWRWIPAGSVRFNGTLFRSDVKDLQTPSAFLRPGTGALVFITRNFAGLRNQGAELELAASPAPNLKLYLNAGFQDAKYVDIAPSILAQQATCLAKIAANTTPRPECLNGIVTARGSIAIPVRAPKQTYNAGGSYAFALGHTGMKLTPAVNFTRVSRANVGTAENAFAEAHTLSNLSLTLSGAKDLWSVTLDCSNCGDVSYNTASLAGLNYLNDPKRYSGRLTFNFK
jgi:iron complex outermembrane receptor protein